MDRVIRQRAQKTVNMKQIIDNRATQKPTIEYKKDTRRKYTVRVAQYIFYDTQSILQS